MEDLYLFDQKNLKLKNETKYYFKNNFLINFLNIFNKIKVKMTVKKNII